MQTTGPFYVGNASGGIGRIKVSNGSLFSLAKLQLGYSSGSTGRLEVAGGDVVISNDINFGSSSYSLAN
jgi:hypothetical protein